MLTCLENGHLFDEDEVERKREPHGEVFSYCPVCGGDIIETKQCDWCCSWINDDFYELPDGEPICWQCYDSILMCTLDEVED